MSRCSGRSKGDMHKLHLGHSAVSSEVISDVVEIYLLECLLLDPQEELSLSKLSVRLLAVSTNKLLSFWLFVYVGCTYVLLCCYANGLACVYSVRSHCIACTSTSYSTQ